MMQQLLLQLAPPPAPTLGNFVPGRNGAALQALCDIARGAGVERFVYLWGEPGSGRSHLLRGLAQAASGGKGLYLCAIPGGSMAADNRIAADDVIAVDNVIAVDDVQDLSASDQIELFDLYNRVRAGAGALVASGDAAPAQLALREDLRSRLAWGLAFQLHPLSDAEKAAALRQQARARALDLPEDVVAYLLRHARRDMASLIAILDALDRYSLEQKRPVTLPLVRDALESMKDTIYTAS
jgi:DnaA family protein